LRRYGFPGGDTQNDPCLRSINFADGVYGTDISGIPSKANQTIWKNRRLGILLTERRTASSCGIKRRCKRTRFIVKTRVTHVEFAMTVLRDPLDGENVAGFGGKKTAPLPEEPFFFDLENPGQGRGTLFANIGSSAAKFKQSLQVVDKQFP
jgi:hypothetical protein